MLNISTHVFMISPKLIDIFIAFEKAESYGVNTLHLWACQWNFHFAKCRVSFPPNSIVFKWPGRAFDKENLCFNDCLWHLPSISKLCFVLVQYDWIWNGNVIIYVFVIFLRAISSWLKLRKVSELLMSQKLNIRCMQKYVEAIFNDRCSRYFEYLRSNLHYTVIKK